MFSPLANRIVAIVTMLTSIVSLWVGWETGTDCALILIIGILLAMWADITEIKREVRK